MHMDPAKTIIDVLGGVPTVAEITGAHVSRVRRWRLPLSSGGTDGAIPREHVFPLFREIVRCGFAAQIEDIVFTPEQRQALKELSQTAAPASSHKSREIMR